MKGAHILVVEDNLDNLKLTGWILEDAGYPYYAALSGEDALKHLETERPALILLDISLPGIQGTEVAQKVRKNPNTTNIPIIAVTAHAIKGEDTKIMASGVDAIVTKPIEEQALLDTITMLLGTDTEFLSTASPSIQKELEP